ncbi:MAG: SMI1/KNR4 family protein [Gammaproteobacteria bacterium]|uniref:SMI1/KNR4 family protein n=1 Tax=Pseudomaricurvus alcaniphilus TaxID=1166482 RepID=UPI00140BD26B|nr:SMI1/KNR4 family protein [Pseudomaricurvus alcaniphilus]MBR9911869.1 SMI1/KNR4 family protein [Gammaproteobacteria bacterium]NHN36080.1 SMI1/KNR4 family protein [Pseudomaricurvus alcaniphilus]
MEELIDELHELAEDVPVPLELPEHDQVVDAQEQILMPLPRDFREFLMTATDVVYGSLEPVTVADPASHTYLPEVTSTAWSLGMPREMIALCECPDGYYCVAQDGEVKLWTHGDYAEETWENVWYWVRDVWMQS